MKLLLRHRRLVVILHFVLALAMLPGMLQLKNDNSPEVFFARDAGALQRYERFRREFGGGPAVRVTLTGSRALWTKPGLAWLGKLEEQAASLPGVEAAVGVATLHQWLLLEWPPPDPAAFRGELLEKGPTSLDLNSGFISPDGETVTLLIVLADMPPAAQRELLRRLDGVLARAPRGIQTQIFGLPILQRAIDRSLGDIVVHILPLLILLAIVFLTLIFRRLRDVAVTLLFVAVCQTILFGLMGYMGVRLNMVTIILALLIFVICLATVVHLLIRFRDLEQRGMKAPLAVLTTYRGKGRPVLWTGITTLVAFGSLITGNTPPVRSLGAWSAVGIVLMTVLVFTLYPAMLTVFQPGGGPGKVRPFEVWTRRWGRALACWAVRRRTRVLAGSAALIVIALLGVTRLQVEEGLTRYFSPHHPVRAGLERLERHGIGVSAAELILSYREKKNNTENEEEAGFQNPPAQQRLARLSDRLRREPLVYGAVGSGDLVESAIRSILVEGEVTDSIRWLALGMMQTVPESRKLLHALVTPDGMSARLTLLLPMLNFNQMQRLFERVTAEAAATFPDAEIWITGQYPLILLAQQTLLQGLTVSLSLTLLCVILVFGLLLRRGRLTWRIIMPNLWPIVLVLGGMGWLQLRLDSVSVMTASIVLGLAVDDTFHTLGHFRRLAPRRGAAAAIEATLERTAPAHILTTVILAAGFLACAFSDFLPVSRMGTFGAVAIIFALTGDLLLIPALLSKTSSIKKAE
jgi:hypothetical protein